MKVYVYIHTIHFRKNGYNCASNLIFYTSSDGFLQGTSLNGTRHLIILMTLKEWRSWITYIQLCRLLFEVWPSKDSVFILLISNITKPNLVPIYYPGYTYVVYLYTFVQNNICHRTGANRTVQVLFICNAVQGKFKASFWVFKLNFLCFK